MNSEYQTPPLRLGRKFHPQYLPVEFPGMANKAQVANIGKSKLFCCEILANMIFSCKMQQRSLGS